jgi:hypothetical protein
MVVVSAGFAIKQVMESVSCQVVVVVVMHWSLAGGGQSR